jgi:choline kinase
MKFTGIILCAGVGSRIRKITNDPKCLLRIKSKNILESNIESLRNFGIEDIRVVVGYKKAKIVNCIKKINKKNNVKIINNSNPNKFGNAYSLYIAIKNLKRHAVIIDGDLIFEDRILNVIKKKTKSGLIVGAGNINDKESTKILTYKNNSRLISQMVDKRYLSAYEKKFFLFQGEALGIIILQKKDLFNLVNLCKNFFSIKKNLLVNWENLLNDYINFYKLRCHKIRKAHRWIEVDTPKDYYRALSLFNS